MNSLFHDYDGLGLADLVKRKEIHPKELVELSIRAIEELNPKLNAVIYKMYDQALEQAQMKTPTGPFAGVPMLLKDIHQYVQGEPTTAGAKVYQSQRAKVDSLYVQQLRKAGAIFMGITNVPEFGLMGITEPKHYGPTRNPWDVDVTPGGSSGGAAAAVATGMVPVAGANDGGGSIRIPAAYCGLFGIKPTRGRTPIGPQAGRIWQGASANHVLTRTVRDSTAMLDCLSVHEKAGAFSAPAFQGRYLDVLDTPLKKPLNIAYSVLSPIGTEVHFECAKAVLDAVQLFEDMGHHVVEETAPIDGKRLAKSYITLYFGEVGAELASLEAILGRQVKRKDVEPATWLIGSLGKSISASEFVLSLREWDDAAQKMELFHETYDLYVTPTTAMPQAAIGELDLTSAERILASVADKCGIHRLLKKFGVVDTLAERSLQRTPFTQLANLTGQPAMSLPLYLTLNGLPLGVQVMAARGREDLLLQFAAQLEETEAWIDVRDNPLYFKDAAKPSAGA